LVGRENLESGEIEDGENGIEIADCENFFLINYADRCAISLYPANLATDITIAETASTYQP
jgi:hypothetical protein